MIGCSICRGRAPLCDDCVAQHVSWLRGAAGARGWAWADRVRAQLGDRAPAAWPAFSGRTAEIARRLINGLDKDERVNAQLASVCWGDARHRWEMTR